LILFLLRLKVELFSNWILLPFASESIELRESFVVMLLLFWLINLGNSF